MRRFIIVLFCFHILPETNAIVHIMGGVLSGMGDLLKGSSDIKIEETNPGRAPRLGIPVGNPDTNILVNLENDHDRVTCKLVKTSGIYAIPIGNRIVRVQCDSKTNGGKWTVIQSRINGSVDFYRTFYEYVYGFGDPETEYFIGLENLYRMTRSKNMELLIILEDHIGNLYTANYDNFKVGPPESNYALISLGMFSGNAGDSLRIHLNQPFSTWDVDNDATDINCAVKHHGAWWYKNCQNSNLNGPYKADVGVRPNEAGITWNGIQPGYSLKSVRMMIRPTIIVDEIQNVNA